MLPWAPFWLLWHPTQFPEKLIPKFTLLAARGKDLPIHGDGSSVRSYLYVEDVAEAFDCVLHKGVTGARGPETLQPAALQSRADA
jgi:dTDP-D-glucose 4,6-dehydratase